MMTVWKLSGIFVLASLLAATAWWRDAAWAETLTIGASHSLKPALREILPMFEKQQSKAHVRVIYGPSQDLREQIEQGAPIDVFLPGAVEEVDRLHEKRLTLKGKPRVYAHTTLVLVTVSPALVGAVSFMDLHSYLVSRIAVGDPRTTSLGKLTAQVLSKLDLGPSPRSRYLYGAHNEVIDWVLSGEADVGVIYRVDAINSPQVRILDEAPSATYTPVAFGEAVVWTCSHAALPFAYEFLDFMLAPPVQAVLSKYGFDAGSPEVGSPRTSRLLSDVGREKP